tara:strand:- start:1720 stop:2853 length:1134 start_codon:yes stop_codon:yes gene_type:complete
MIIGIPKEILGGENRIGITPNTVKELVKKDFEILIESNAGLGSFISDSDYQSVGAKIISDAKDLYQSADMVVKVNPPSKEEIELFKNDSILLSFMQPTKELELVKLINNKNITGFSLHLIPRTTLAQKMDALSSQTNIAGYRAVLMGAMHIKKYMPLLMTAAGTIQPAKVLVIGAGVSGLQAIATAKRLGAQVEAFDVRPVVKEQVESLGAKFIEVESDSEDGVGDGGYAKETSEEYKKKQSELMAAHLSKSDIVITTALIPGRPAPKLITDKMVESMKPGSAIIDLASENGGNCTLTKVDEITNHNGIIIDGTSNIASEMSIDATGVLAKNIVSFLTHVFNEKKINIEDEITSGSLYCHNGEVVHQMTKDALKGDN